MLQQSKRLKALRLLRKSPPERAARMAAGNPVGVS